MCSDWFDPTLLGARTVLATRNFSTHGSSSSLGMLALHRLVYRHRVLALVGGLVHAFICYKVNVSIPHSVSVL